MPMDKYTRQSHKTYQHARRRNNTAQNMLENQLKQLDKDIRFEKASYSRNQNRVKHDLVTIEGVSSDFEKSPTTESRDSTKRKNRMYDWKTMSPIYRSTINDMGSDDTSNSGKIVIKTDNGSQCNKSSISVCSPILNHKQMPSGKNHAQPISSFFKTSTPVPPDTIYRPKPAESSITNTCITTFEKNQELVRCEHNHFNLPMNRACSFFPCKYPPTYHTIGFRREDLCPQVKDVHNEAGGPGDDLDLFRIPSNDNNISSNKDQNEKETCCNKRKGNNAFSTSWIKTSQKPSHPFEFHPTVEGPIFGYTPTDPILERIRAHKQEAKLMESRPCPRLSIKDRIRGVKQLVKEMKLANDRVKPQDWATNYGKRVPTRDLLNPVVPV